MTKHKKETVSSYLKKKNKKETVSSLRKIFGIPREEVSCPGCGRLYGSNNTKVDIISQECSTCVASKGRSPVKLIDAVKFVKYLLSIF
jgi:hypothetical protein